jgi:hypothetical protein
MEASATKTPKDITVAYLLPRLRRAFQRLSTERSLTFSLSTLREEDSESESVSCITGKLIEDVLCRGPISVAVTDLL